MIGVGEAFCWFCWGVAACSGVGVVRGLYTLRRSLWVHQHRMKVLERSIPEFLALPPYEYMVYARWWVWRFEEFMPWGKHGRRDSPSHRFGC